jgi:hypothetical protein
MDARNAQGTEMQTGPHVFSESALLPAPPLRVYAVLADYRDAHRRILPSPPFVSLEVLEGGTGAGTVIRVGMRVLGRMQTYRAVVTEPEPGRTLVETNENGYITTFTVEPVDDGRSQVTISTQLTGRGGIAGAAERWLVPRLLRPVYVRELAQLAAVAADGKQ